MDRPFLHVCASGCMCLLRDVKAKSVTTSVCVCSCRSSCYSRSKQPEHAWTLTCDSSSMPHAHTHTPATHWQVPDHAYAGFTSGICMLHMSGHQSYVHAWVCIQVCVLSLAPLRSVSQPSCGRSMHMAPVECVCAPGYACNAIMMHSDAVCVRMGPSMPNFNCMALDPVVPCLQLITPEP